MKIDKFADNLNRTEHITEILIEMIYLKSNINHLDSLPLLCGKPGNKWFSKYGSRCL